MEENELKDHKERLRSLSKKISELDRQFRSLESMGHDLEARIRVLESADMERFKQDLYKLESKISSFESDHDDRKENWKIAINFVIQLIWVSMAAWLLTKLGLQAPL
jgi:chromosome segregation ATPase